MDKKGTCINCMRIHAAKYLPGEQKPETVYYQCVFCNGPFPAGIPHRKCMRLMGARAARGQSGTITYWRRRAYWPKNKRRAGRTVLA